MIEAIAAASQQTPVQAAPDWTQQTVAQEDVQRFENVFEASAPAQTETPQAESAYTVMTADASQTPGDTGTVGEKILDTVARLGESYEELFPKDLLDNLAKGSENGSAFSASDNSFGGMLDRFYEMNSHATQVSLWSTEIGLISSSVSKGTQGIQTLFRNSG